MSHNGLDICGGTLNTKLEKANQINYPVKLLQQTKPEI